MCRLHLSQTAPPKTQSVSCINKSCRAHPKMHKGRDTRRSAPIPVHRLLSWLILSRSQMVLRCCTDGCIRCWCEVVQHHQCHSGDNLNPAFPFKTSEMYCRALCICAAQRTSPVYRERTEGLRLRMIKGECATCCSCITFHFFSKSL